MWIWSNTWIILSSHRWSSRPWQGKIYHRVTTCWSGSRAKCHWSLSKFSRWRVFHLRGRPLWLFRRSLDTNVTWSLVMNISRTLFFISHAQFLSVLIYILYSSYSFSPVSIILLLVYSKHYSPGFAELIFDGKSTGFRDLHMVFDSGSSYTYLNSQAYHFLILWVS